MRRSIRIGRAPLFLTGSLEARCRLVFLERTSPSWLAPWPTSIRKLKAGGPGPVSLRERIDACIDRAPALPLGDPSPGLSQRPCIQRPTASTGSIPTRFERPKSQEIPRGISGHPGQTRPSPAARKGPAEWSFWNPLGATGGTQTHSRRTGRRLGQLRYARQGLVRDSESNTKYGGNRRKTGGNAAPVMGPSISDS